MGATGVQFWRLPAEETDLLDFLESTGTIVAFPASWEPTAAALDPVPLRKLILERDAAKVVFTLQELADIIHPIPQQMNGQQCYRVDYFRECLVMYTRGRFTSDNRLTYSMVSARFKYADDGALVDKDPRFRVWVDKVFRWVRRWTPEWHGHKAHRLTRRVAELPPETLEIIV